MRELKGKIVHGEIVVGDFAGVDYFQIYDTKKQPVSLGGDEILVITDLIVADGTTPEDYFSNLNDDGTPSPGSLVAARKMVGLTEQDVLDVRFNTPIYLHRNTGFAAIWYQEDAFQGTFTGVIVKG
jgi:hypothetical protein